MFLISILSALLSSMSMWADSPYDMRLSLNDIYMATLMTGWMFMLMSVMDKNLHHFGIGLSLIVISIYAIRTQLFIDKRQYLLSMIPHHSMAVHMSRKLIEKEGDNVLYRLPQKIFETQQAEIKFFKEPPPL